MSGNDVVPSDGGVLSEWSGFLKSIPGAGKALTRLVTNVAEAGASWIDIAKAKGEQKASAIRSDTASADAVAKALSKAAVKQVAFEEGLAERAVDAFLSDVVRKQKSREGVARAAVEDLQTDPPSSDTLGPSDDWMNQFQRYAEDVSSEDVQRMWGRVLASEIRNPGVVSIRALRTINEIEPYSADIFNKLRHSICGSVVIIALSGVLQFNETFRLVESGLLVDPVGEGHLANYKKKQTANGSYIWVITFGSYAVGFDFNADLSSVKSNSILSDDKADKSCAILKSGNDLKVNVYVLTSVGYDLVRILFDNELDNVRLYVKKLAEEIKNTDIYIYQKTDNDEFHVVEAFRG